MTDLLETPGHDGAAREGTVVRVILRAQRSPSAASMGRRLKDRLAPPPSMLEELAQIIGKAASSTTSALIEGARKANFFREDSTTYISKIEAKFSLWKLSGDVSISRSERSPRRIVDANEALILGQAEKERAAAELLREQARDQRETTDARASARALLAAKKARLEALGIHGPFVELATAADGGLPRTGETVSSNVAIRDYAEAELKRASDRAAGDDTRS